MHTYFMGSGILRHRVALDHSNVGSLAWVFAGISGSGPPVAAPGAFHYMLAAGFRLLPIRGYASRIIWHSAGISGSGPPDVAAGGTYKPMWRPRRR